MKTVYVAFLLSFSPKWKSYREKIKLRLHEVGCTVVDPWEAPFHTAIAEASTLENWHSRVAAFRRVPRRSRRPTMK